MKIKPGFIKREIDETYVVIPTGANLSSIDALIDLNETGAFLWDCLAEDATIAQLVEKMTEAYDVSPEEAEAGIRDFVAFLQENGIIEP